MKYHSHIKSSEWSRWDLHIHTPSSIVASEYGGNTDIVWNKFIDELENLPEEIKVIGINDYLFLDGYEKVLKEKIENKRLNNIDLVLPVIEVRLKEFVGNKNLGRINYHIIFAPEKELNLNVLKAQFLSRLTAKAKLNSEYTDNYSWGGVITRESLSDLGKHIYEQTPEDKRGGSKNYLEIGFNNLNFELSHIKEILGEKGESNTFLSGKYFKALGKYEWDSFQWDGSPSEKKTIINDVHFIFSASPTAEGADKNRISLKENGVNDRLLHCSDAHSFAKDKIETKPKELGHCYTWIKAERTFEGLKQVLYEPSRLKLQVNSPDPKRLDKVIKSISFEKHIDFSKEVIPLNSNLNTIIGGKSSGKSLLLYYTANTIDWRYAQKQLQIKDPHIKKLDEYGFSKEGNFDCIVEWMDGVKYSYENDSNLSNNRQFVYIPQSYIINLTSNIEINSRKELGKFIRDILLQEKSSHDLYDEFIQNVKKLDTDRNLKIELYFNIQDKINDKNKSIKGIGDLVGIRNQIKSLTEQINKLKEGTSNKEDIDRYESLIKRKQNIDRLKQEIRRSLTQIKEFIATIKGQGIEGFNNLNELFNELKIKPTKLILSQLSSIILKFDKDLESIESLIDAYLDEYIKRVVKLDEILKIQLEPIQKKLKYSEQIKSIQIELDKETKKKEQIKQIISEIEILKKEQINTKNNLFADYRKAYKQYEIIVKNLNQRANNFEDVQLVGSVKFHKNRFVREMWNILNQRSNKKLLNISILEESEDNKLYDVDFESHIIDKETIFNYIANNELVYKSYNTAKDCAVALFRDLFFDYWELKIGGDEMASMSPGKANLAILKLLIELSESDCPILIDQPEDNLDNRSIYTDLVKFIKERKDTRQFIIVTHNPNIVVGADSENVIVANQAGQDISRENKECRFEYVNRGIECSFRKPKEDAILYKMGIREHITEILEGGEDAFRKRERKYGLK